MDIDPSRQRTADAYDSMYRKENYFGYRRWLYGPFLAALATKAGLRRGSSVLDAGCGQGFFAALLSELGFTVLGVDVSPAGVETANTRFGSSTTSFRTGDIMSLPYNCTFDCVYCRSCSLYNDHDLQRLHCVTDVLLSYIKPGGVLIFDYYTKLSPRKTSSSWRYHQLTAVRQHFARYPHTEVYFSLRFEAMLFRGWTLTSALTRLNSFVSRLTGIGGEAIAMVWKD
ncbi:hypothetical protein BH18ACI4_BH18ACI4_09790 [soil metagenome]